jgi:hypothetical protein
MKPTLRECATSVSCAEADVEATRVIVVSPRAGDAFAAVPDSTVELVCGVIMRGISSCACERCVGMMVAPVFGVEMMVSGS